MAGLLGVLNPDWESFVNFDVSADQQRELVIRDRRLLSQVDDILRDLTRDGSEVMERFRELTRCHPMLVLSRLPRQIMQHFGTVSLSQLYLNTTFFQNVRPPQLQGHSQLDIKQHSNPLIWTVDPERHANRATTHASPTKCDGTVLPIPVRDPARDSRPPRC